MVLTSQDLLVAELQYQQLRLLMNSSVSLFGLIANMGHLPKSWGTLNLAALYTDLIKNVLTVGANSLETLYLSEIFTNNWEEFQNSFEKLHSLIGKPDATADDFLTFVSEEFPYYRVNPYVLMVELENLSESPTQEEILEILKKAQVSGEEGISGKELLKELDRLAQGAMNLLSLVKETRPRTGTKRNLLTSNEQDFLSYHLQF